MALFALVAASGCINGESITTSAHQGPGAADDPVGGAAAMRGRSANAGIVAVPAAGDVLIAGGSSASNRTLASAEFFDPSTNQFLATGHAFASRAGAVAAPISDSKVLLDGGFSGGATIKQFSLNLNGKVLSSSEIFDPTTGKFSLAAMMATPRMAFTATALGNGKVLVAGGLDTRGNAVDNAEG